MNKMSLGVSGLPSRIIVKSLAHAYNPSHLMGGDQEDFGSSPAQAKS
jgi:hypothetical protein